MPRKETNFVFLIMTDVKSKSHNICCVVNCSANSGGLYAVLRSDKKQSDAWVAAIHRINQTVHHGLRVNIQGSVVLIFVLGNQVKVTHIPIGVPVFFQRIIAKNRLIVMRKDTKGDLPENQKFRYQLRERRKRYQFRRPLVVKQSLMSQESCSICFVVELSQEMAFLMLGLKWTL